MGDKTEEEPENVGIAATRSRREVGRKAASRKAALDVLKEARQSGKKHLSHVAEFEPVYDEVALDEYSKLVSSRRDDDWIVDDDGQYVEDGREIFDDDEEMDDAAYRACSKQKKGPRANKSKIQRSGMSSEDASSSTKGRSIKEFMLKKDSKSLKRSTDSDDLKKDEFLGQLLDQIKSEPRKVAPLKPLVVEPKQLDPTAARPASQLNPFAVRTGTGIKRPKSLQQPEPVQEKQPAPIQPIQNATPEYPIDTLDDDDDIMTDDYDSQTLATTPASQLEPVPAVARPQEHRGFEEKPKDEDIWAGKINFLDDICPKTTNADVGAVADIHVDHGTLPLTVNDNGEKVLKLFWLDAFEDPFRHPGTVWMFGKVFVEEAKAFVSCCLVLKNIERHIFLLRRDPELSMSDVYEEFDKQVAPRFKIDEYKSKPTKKYYAFELTDVPREADYLEVVYSAKYPVLPADLKGNTFSRVFGATQTSLEQLLLSRKIRGPCWLEVRGAMPSQPPMSWCKVEAVCDQPGHVSLLSASQSGPQPPPVTILSFNMKTVMNPKTHQNEVVLVSGLVHHQFPLDRPAPRPAFNSVFCAIARASDEVWPFDFAKVLGQSNASSSSAKIERMESERALLGFLMAKIGKLDPDVIVGYDVVGFDIDVLLHRLIQNKIPNWSRLGRLRRSQPPYIKGRMSERQVVTGRLLCDLKISSKELIHCKSYDLGALVEKLLNRTVEQRVDINCDLMRQAYASSIALVSAAGSCLQDNADTLHCVCELNALPLALQITQVAGNVMSRTLMGGRSERNEFLLLHAFYEKNYILPDKTFGNKRQHLQLDESLPQSGTSQANQGRRKPAYSGGLVLDPKVGYYDTYILLMDFNSLYPSIIQEYNICFTTVSRVLPNGAEGDYVPELPSRDCEVGILPSEIRKLVESRRAVKKLLKDSTLSAEQKMQYDLRQMALKLTANSMYGCLGFAHSRFYAKHLAALVTARGREILLQTKDLVEKMNLEVIYGDTDSIMINSNSRDYDAVFQLGSQVKAAVNKLYKLLELDIDGVFRYMLLLKKKKYAAVTVEKRPDGRMVQHTELKGLDIVRRDWCQLASDAGKQILDKILSDCPPDDRLSHIHELLENIALDLKEGKVALQLLAITKQLTKEPDDYPDKKSLPHVQVALRINSKGGKKLRAGDTIQYVICDDGSNLAATQRAYHIDELIENKGLKIDLHYYLAQQLHPVISRLCDPLEGTDSARIAQCLGLDPEQFRRSIRTEGNAEEASASELKDEEKFQLCDKFVIVCECGQEIRLSQPVIGSGRDAYFCLMRCSNRECDRVPLERLAYVTNRLTLAMRSQVKRYYDCWLVCEDPGCDGRSRQLPLVFQRAFPVCSTCMKSCMYRDFTDTQLYTQLLFYQHLFDVDRHLAKATGEEARLLKGQLSNEVLRQGYAALKQSVDQFMTHNKYSMVSLNKVFESLFPMAPARFKGSHFITDDLAATSN